jgi:hypothetical protein
MIDRAALLADLQKLVKRLEADLRERSESVAEIDAHLRTQYAEARQSQRTAGAFEVFRDDLVTQSAVAWVLACVFVRFLEDNGLLDERDEFSPDGRRSRRLISGATAELLRQARDHTTTYFQQHPAETDREYLMSVFREVEAFPGMAGLYDERHNPLWTLSLSGDGGREALEFWRRLDPDTGRPRHDFTDPDWSTRFLGDLYQDLSETARDKYALLQTPEFVEEFILDRTLEPAIAEFGYQVVRLIDPTCGSGHFLLGGFRRLLDRWTRDEPGTHTTALAQRALDGVYGVDLNPYATAIARFRLLVAALRACGVARLAEAPDFRVHVVTGDSLLHGRRFGAITGTQATIDREADPLKHVYATEDREDLSRILGQQYHAVVGNPPYITVKDKALNDAYRQTYGSCHRQYSLAVPFMERFFELGLSAVGSQSAGFVGMITANSFMKREFGKRLIESFMPRWDLTHLIDTSGAYIPGHGTPTVILFGRNRFPVEHTVRAVMGIRGESKSPEDPARGLVWSAIVGQVDQPGSQSDFVSVSDTARASFHKHPWSIGGGGAAELKTMLDEFAATRLGEIVHEIGFGAVTREDEAYILSAPVVRRLRIPQAQTLPLVEGEELRDWQIHDPTMALWPYDPTSLAASASIELQRLLWPYRRLLSDRVAYGQTQLERGLQWFEYSMFFRDRFRTPLSIAFAFVATHNHFVLDCGGKVFKQSAPIIKLTKGATEDDHLALLGLLNSSTACFWMRQVFYPKGGDHVGSEGARVRKTLWEERFEFDSTKMHEFPLVSSQPLDAARELDRAGRQLEVPTAVVAVGLPTAERFFHARQDWVAGLERMIALQEELDWACYRLYGLLEDDLTFPRDQVPRIRLGERAFEIVLARQMARGELQTTWFERHGSTPIAQTPKNWPEDYRQLVERRIRVIELNPSIRLIEQPEYKRRWNTEPWETQQERALRSWLLDRLESPACWPQLELQSCAALSDRVRGDAQFVQVAELYRGRADFDVAALVAELVESEAVPFLPVLRYTDSGQRKRALWERTWELQRREDSVDASLPLPDDSVQKISVEKERARCKAAEVGEIPVPPKYTAADFLRGDYWRLRGKLDVPKERFISLPGCHRDADPSLVVGWAGWDHLQQAKALATFYIAMKDQEGWQGERLTPLLAGILELLPWLKQWHNAYDPTAGSGLGDYYEGFLNEEARGVGLTLEQIRAWKPVAGPGATRLRRKGRQPKG